MLNRLKTHEDTLLEMSGLDIDKFEKTFTTIEMDGEPFRIRTVAYGDRSKKTLLMTHGYMLSGVLAYYKVMKRLSEYYRLVIFDQGSFG